MCYIVADGDARHPVETRVNLATSRGALPQDQPNHPVRSAEPPNPALFSSPTASFGGINTAAGVNRHAGCSSFQLQLSTPALTSSRNLSASDARPAATHWKEAFCPALTSSSPSLEKCGALSKETEGGREKSGAIKRFYYLSATRIISQSMFSSKGLFSCFFFF